MKIIYILLSFVFIQTINGQSLDFNKFEFNGLKFYSSKSDIIKKLGNPNWIFEPNYDCGGLSSKWQGVDFFSLDFDKIKFTGNEKERYLIEKIDFKNDNSIKLIYENHELNCKTELSELAKIFGEQILKQIKNGQSNGVFIVHHDKRDDGIKLEIENGKLIRFEYWTSC